MPVEIIDLRHEQRNPPDVKRKFKRQNGKVLCRDPERVTGITIHQTAVKYGVANYQIARAHGDRKLAMCRRALRVACHVMSFHDGYVCWANPLEWYVYHGNRFNAFELGIEIDGNYPGLIGGDTWNKKHQTITTPESIEAARAGVKLLVDEGRKMGMPIEFIHAHRQSSVTRRSDPGEELWKKVVLEYAVPELGLKTETRLTIGNGRPIPEEWDPDGFGEY